MWYAPRSLYPAVDSTNSYQIDKWKHFLGLLLVCRFNGSDRDTRDGKTGVYELMYGK